MKRIASHHPTLYIQDVARGALFFLCQHLDALIANWRKAGRAIEHGHIESTYIGRTGHQIIIAGASKQRTAGQGVEYRVVLHLNERHQIWYIITARENFLSNGVHFVPIA